MNEIFTRFQGLAFLQRSFSLLVSLLLPRRDKHASFWSKDDALLKPAHKRNRSGTNRLDADLSKKEFYTKQDPNTFKIFILNSLTNPKRRYLESVRVRKINVSVTVRRNSEPLFDNRRFPEITGEDNLTVFSYSGRVKSPQWRRQRRRADLRQF